MPKMLPYKRNITIQGTVSRICPHTLKGCLHKCFQLQQNVFSFTAEQGFEHLTAAWCSTVKSRGIDFSGARAFTKDMVFMCEEIFLFFYYFPSDPSFLNPRPEQNTHCRNHCISSKNNLKPVFAPDLGLNESLSWPRMQTKKKRQFCHLYIIKAWQPPSAHSPHPHTSKHRRF